MSQSPENVPRDVELDLLIDQFSTYHRPGLRNLVRATIAKYAAPAQGQHVSIDISTGDHDAGRRAFGVLTGERNGDADNAWLADGYVNYPTPPAGEGQEPVAWLVPKRCTFEGAKFTSATEQAQANLEGAAMWALSWVGDAPPYTDARGVTHKPVPLYRHPAPQAAQPAASVEPIRSDIQAVLAMLDVPVVARISSHGGNLISPGQEPAEFETAVPLVREVDHRRACEKIIATIGAQPAQDERDEDAYVIARMSKLLAEIALIVRGPEQSGHRHGYADLPARVAALSTPPIPSFQDRVQPWMMECFGSEIAADGTERNHRFFEEAAELVQALGMNASEAHQLVDYVFGRPAGEPTQEAGGVMVTLAALCLARGLDMHGAGETELARINVPETVAKIRAKQAAKPKHSPLPEASTPPMEGMQQRGPLTDEQRAHALALAGNMGMPIWDCRVRIVEHVSSTAYVNGRLDAIAAMGKGGQQS